MEGQQGGLILQQKWEDLADYVFSAVLRDMPKQERFTLGADIRACIWQVQAALVQIALHTGPRRQLLNLVDVQAKVLMSMIRLGIRIGAVPRKREEPAAEKLSEIGRIVGGLLKVR